MYSDSNSLHFFFEMVQLALNKRSFGYQLGNELATSHYLNQWCISLSMHTLFRSPSELDHAQGYREAEGRAVSICIIQLTQRSELPHGPKEVLYLCHESLANTNLCNNTQRKYAPMSKFYPVMTISLLWQFSGKTYHPPHPEGGSVRDRLELNNLRSSCTTVLAINQWVGEAVLCCAKY